MFDLDKKSSFREKHYTGYLLKMLSIRQSFCFVKSHHIMNSLLYLFF